MEGMQATALLQLTDSYGAYEGAEFVGDYVLPTAAYQTPRPRI